MSRSTTTSNVSGQMSDLSLQQKAGVQREVVEKPSALHHVDTKVSAQPVLSTPGAAISTSATAGSFGSAQPAGLRATGVAHGSASIPITANLPTEGAMALTGSVPLFGELPVSATIPIEGDYPVKANIVVEGVLRLRGSIPLKGVVPVRGEVPITGSMPVKANLAASGALPVHGHIPIEGIVPVQGAIPIHGDIPIDGIVGTTGMVSGTGLMNAGTSAAPITASMGTKTIPVEQTTYTQTTTRAL